MRQLTIVIDPRSAQKVREESRRHDLTILAEMDARREGEDRLLMLCNAPNRKIEGFLGALESVPDLHVTFLPQGVLALSPPANEAEEQVLDILPRSPIEIFLSGLQSIGSWKGFLSYAAVGGIIVWIALFTESMFLLVASMLIAPFAGPAMTTAMATARGDLFLLKRALLRYVAAIGTAVAVAFALSVIFDQQISTGLMNSVSMRSNVSILLPLAAGVAGALNLAQSERSSLVSGAATGMLVAAALAPPAGLVGMGLAIGQMDLVLPSLWALATQIVGINLAGFVVFRLYGVSPTGARYPRGKPWLTKSAVAATLLTVAGLLALQFGTGREYQQSSIAQRITATVQEAVEDYEDVQLVGVQSSFTRSRPQGENPVWITVRVEADLTDAQQSAMAQNIGQMVERQHDVEALVDLTSAS